MLRCRVSKHDSIGFLKGLVMVVLLRSTPTTTYRYQNFQLIHDDGKHYHLSESGPTNRNGLLTPRLIRPEK